MFTTSKTSSTSPVLIVPVLPTAGPGDVPAIGAGASLLRRTLGRQTGSRRTFGINHPSRRTFGGKYPSRRTFGGKYPSRRTFGVNHP